MSSAYAKYQAANTSKPSEMSFSFDEVPADTQINHSDSIKYWDSIPSDINGMLGGYPHVSRVDIQGSRAFLVKCGISATKAVVSARPKRTLVGQPKENVKPDEKDVVGENNQEKTPKLEEKRLKRVVDCGAG